LPQHAKFALRAFGLLGLLLAAGLLTAHTRALDAGAGGRNVIPSAGLFGQSIAAIPASRLDNHLAHRMIVFYTDLGT
jgi:hypothetical protein